MAVTGHKSVQSLLTYQRVDTIKNKNGPNPYQECYSSARTTSFTFHRKKLAITAPHTHQEGT